MAEANIKIELKSNIDTVWKIVTDNENYAWRSDIKRIAVSENENQFVEYTNDGFATTFSITKKEEKKQYEFDMSNKNMKGHWTGVFRELSGGTEIDFREEVSANNPIMNLFVGSYLKKQQKQYLNDLKKVLCE